MKYIYPAIFTLDKSDKAFPNGVYQVKFVDLDTCYTFGNTLEEAYENAADALNLALWDLEERKAAIPAATAVSEVHCGTDAFVSLVTADTLEYRKQYDTKAVRKSLTIPRWLDTLAQENNINFSNILKRALLKELNISPQ
ncbi:MAG: type II toxin-antitoxin system HicB family antitoxin [Phascolarctobacterium sp.]|uniref:type II toxin-antitoxin system HicB family antitoxin n=1 Tax=Phascolarctobacterium sp. TaxID=2049039 RepID=UPI0026DC7FB8|nr:type II toxin-antitoxin system HicB family antitoxin [Phascolarctobacterium sp.]MDO4920214.1 type II toxin-antitoxin system HicB family antitoxin [Phascolarctobacterium sp.]